MSRRPSPALLVALLALLLAASGGAFAAVRSTGSAVNIVDPTTAAHVAKVSSGGSLQITGSVTATPSSPGNYVRGAAFDVAGGGGCVKVLAPPAGKALIVRNAEIDTFDDPSPGFGQTVELFVGPCGELVADVNPPEIGPTSLAWDPGLAVPAGSELSAVGTGSLSAEVYASGYLVSASSVPAAAAPAPAVPPQQR